MSEALTGTTDQAHEAGVTGTNTNTTPDAGAGVYGESPTAGVIGFNTDGGHGVVGHGGPNGGEGVRGESSTGWAAVGGYNNAPGGGPGLWGIGAEAGGEGVHGESSSGYAAVAGYNKKNGTGVWGIGGPEGGEGVHGESSSLNAAVAGINNSPTGGPGVWAIAGPNGGEGVHAESSSGYAAVAGYNKKNGAGIWGIGGPEGGEGVHAESHSGAAAVAGFAKAAGAAGYFDGNVVVTGDIILPGADYAEAMTTSDPEVNAGSVVVVGHDSQLHPCRRPYDSAVAGIVSGAGGVRPAIVLDRHSGSANLALMGKAWCKATAAGGPIRPGDLLTTSATSGHCQRVDDRSLAFGAVIGKALTGLDDGEGLVRVLVGRH
ncbi:MAG: hypothetical protein QM658_13320 [Gordonia sp. (in: high G+C Gram-positive bacteria)]